MLFYAFQYGIFGSFLQGELSTRKIPEKPASVRIMDKAFMYLYDTILDGKK